MTQSRTCIDCGARYPSPTDYLACPACNGVLLDTRLWKARTGDDDTPAFVSAPATSANPVVRPASVAPSSPERLNDALASDGYGRVSQSAGRRAVEATAPLVPAQSQILAASYIGEKNGGLVVVTDRGIATFNKRIGAKWTDKVDVIGVIAAGSAFRLITADGLIDVEMFYDARGRQNCVDAAECSNANLPTWARLHPGDACRVKYLGDHPGLPKARAVVLQISHLFVRFTTSIISEPLLEFRLKHLTVERMGPRTIAFTDDHGTGTVTGLLANPGSLGM